MVIAKHLSTPSTSVERPLLQELDRVTLRVARDERGGRSVPVGSSGTIVAVLKGGEAYMVEFVRPFRALVTVEPGDIAPVRSVFA